MGIYLGLLVILIDYLNILFYFSRVFVIEYI